MRLDYYDCYIGIVIFLQAHFSIKSRRFPTWPSVHAWALSLLFFPHTWEGERGSVCVCVCVCSLYSPCMCVYLHAGRDYQERAAVSAGQEQGASSGTAATETAGELSVCACMHTYTVHAFCMCVVHVSLLTAGGWERWVTAGQEEGASSGTAATETAG